jgi:hypothetical protein
MPIILTDEQYLLWIKDPSVSPYINNYVYRKDDEYYDRKVRKNILNVETLNNPLSFVNKIIVKAFNNTSAKQKIVEQIKKYNKSKRPRLFIQNDKWKYDKEEIIKHNIVNNDYTKPYFTNKDCRDWVSNHLFNPRTQDSIKQNGHIYIELLYMTLQYGIDITEIENNLHISSSSSNNKDKQTKDIIDSVRLRLQFMKDTDKLFMQYDIKSFDDLLEFRTLEITPTRNSKSKNTFSVSSYSSSPIKSINTNEKKQLSIMKLMQNEQENKLYEYALQKKQQKKHQQKLQKNMDMQNVNTKIFSRFRTFIENLNEGIWENEDMLYTEILNNITEKDMYEITTTLRTYYDEYPNNGGEDLSKNSDNMFRIARRFIVDIYAQLINPRYKLHTMIEVFSYKNQFYNFSKNLLIDNIKSTLQNYIDNYYNPSFKLDEKIKFYFRLLVRDEIPYNYVLHGSLNPPRARDKRVKLNNLHDDYKNCYYDILYDNTKSSDSNIQYRLPKGEGFLNGRILMRKFALIKTENIYNYFNHDVRLKIIIDADNNDNDYTYEECKDWAIMPIINPRTFEDIIIDSPTYNRLLCMTYQYDCKLIPRMITSRGYEIRKALIHVIKNILLHEKKPQQTREELERYILDRQFLREKGAELMKDIPDIVGLKWKDYGTKRPNDRIDITVNNVALVSAMELKIRRDRNASRSSQDPVAFYIFFTEEELGNLQVANLKENCFIKVKKHYYIPVVTKVKQRPKKTIGRTAYYIADKHYNIIDCMKWIMNPNRDPKMPTQLIVTDSKEYNEIFEQALLFNSNIQPIGITPEGIEFKKQILKQKKRHFKILKVKNKKTNGKISHETIIDIVTKNEICAIINNIYTYTEDNEIDKKYLDFKMKMLKMCYKYLGKKETCNLPNINKQLNDIFVKKVQTPQKKFIYYEDSALASVILDYDKQYKRYKLYNEDAQNNYINNYKNIFKVEINEIFEIDGSIIINEKEAIDAGGVSREFFTKFFEELFCDEVNTKRPFILPEQNSSTNRYYINPNFEPDEKFQKVINYAQRHNYAQKYIKKKVYDYNTEEGYQHIYYIIGKVLSVTLVNIEIGTPKQFSTYILSRFINQQNNLKHYDLLYFYLRDFNNSRAYINMMNKQEKNNIDLCEWSFNDYYIITRASKSNPDGHLLTKENYPKYMLQLSKHIITKNFLFNGVKGSNKNMKGRYESLFAGFNNELRTFLYNNDVSIDMVDKLITNEQLDEAILLEFAKKLKISVIKFVDNNPYSNVFIANKTEEEKQEMIAEMKVCMTNIITIKRTGETEEEHYKFIRRLLQFWTGFNYYDKRADNEENGYKLFYFYGSDVHRFPSTHTCFYQLDFFGFPHDKTTIVEKEEYLYEKLIVSINNAPGMEMA